jgi:hypothetical protein
MEHANVPGHWKLAADKQVSLMLLGQNEKSQTWAYLTSRNDKGKTQVIFLNVPVLAAPADDIESEGDAQDEPAVKAKNLDEMSLTYPFSIFRLTKTSKSLNQLKHFV